MSIGQDQDQSSWRMDREWRAAADPQKEAYLVRDRPALNRWAWRPSRHLPHIDRPRFERQLETVAFK